LVEINQLIDQFIAGSINLSIKKVSKNAKLKNKLLLLERANTPPLEKQKKLMSISTSIMKVLSSVYSSRNMR